MREIPGGVTAARGFTAGGVHCGVKKKSSDPNAKEDVALILSDRPTASAAVFTSNRVKAAPIYVTMEHLAAGDLRAVVVNSGNANACCPDDRENAEAMCRLAAEHLGLTERQIAVASTGVIGQTLNLKAIAEGIPRICPTRAGHAAAQRAILTTDTREKECAVAVEIGGKTVTVGAMAKGSGMIHPNMGTMLCFITTDCAISPALLQAALDEVVPRTFNRVTVDGDTSTNDTCLVLANGAAGNPPIETAGEGYTLFANALFFVCRTLSRAIAADGEGASRLITCIVGTAPDEGIAERLGKSVVGSSLVKAALYGADANWGRILCAMGYAGVPFDPESVNVTFASDAGRVAVCKDGRALPFDEDTARTVLSRPEVTIAIDLQSGTQSAECWGCDLTYDYVKINGDYRT